MKYSLSFFAAALLCLCHPVFAQSGGQHAELSDTLFGYQKTMQGLRNSPAPPSAVTICYVTDPGREGAFRCDPADKSSPDDSAMTIIASGGRRFKRLVEQGMIDVRWFGATGDSRTDDWHALQKAINYILNNDAVVRTLYFPPGTYKISRPLLIARLNGVSYRHSSISLTGPANSKLIAAGYANIAPTFNNTFAIGIQSGKGVLIRDLAITGRFTFPDRLSLMQVDTLSFDEWTDGVSRQNTLSPYAGIVIDPFSDSTAYPKNSDMYPGLHAYCPQGLGRSGSTSVQVVGCAVRNFIVGVMITPSDQQNGELIDVIDCDLGANKVSYAMGQAQSKECHVTRMKCWQPCHTVFDNMTYGFRHGDGAGVPMVDGVNIACAVKQFCRIHAKSFSGVFRNIYSEGLFRLGFAGGGATLTFEDCQFDFGTQDPGLPYPDYYVLGSGATFHNCILRLYPGVPGARLVLSGTNNYYEGGTTNAPPVAANLDNNGIYPNPTFSNVSMYYSGGVLGNGNRGIVSATSIIQGSNGTAKDPVYYGNMYRFLDPFYGVSLYYTLTYNDTYERTVELSGKPVIHIDKSRWTAWFKLGKATDTNQLKKGDFILTAGLRYQDQDSGTYAPTYPVGFIRNIGHDTVYVDNLAVGIREGMSLNLWMDYFVTADAPLTGDLAAGSNRLVKVQGQFPAVGERMDIPMLPPGTYVTAIDPGAGTIRFSDVNYTGQSFSDYTFMNGYPTIDLYSAYDLPVLQQYGKTLIGGAYFHRMEAKDIKSRSLSDPVPGLSTITDRVINTNIKGDTSLHKLSYMPLSPGEAHFFSSASRPMTQ